MPPLAVVGRNLRAGTLDEATVATLEPAVLALLEQESR
jgi:hypothetical protein